MNTPPGAGGNIVSVAINSVGSWQATPLAVDASASEAQYDLILVALSSAGGSAPEDIHITMVPALDSLDSYSHATFDVVEDDGTITEHPELYYVMPGGSGTPAFTLMDNGVVTIPKGSNFGYLKIKTTSANYFGTTNYAYAYRIGSIQESGYTISANNGFSITPFLAKNPWDGVYSLSINTTGWGAYGIADDNKFRTYGDVALSTTGLTTCSFLNLVRGDNLQGAFTTADAQTGFGAASPSFAFDSNNKLVDVFNAIPDDGRGRKFLINPAASSTENLYDPVTKTITANYIMKQNGRPNQVIKEVLTYKKSR